MKKQVKTYARLLVRLLKTPCRREYVLGISFGFLCSALVYGAVFMWPRNVTYSYASNKNCVQSPAFLPNLLKPSAQSAYRIETQDKVTIAGYPLYAREACVTLTGVPTTSSSTVALKPLGISPLSKKLTVNTPDMPKLSASVNLEKPIATSDALKITLDQPDATFSYRLLGNEKTSQCSVVNTEVSCKLSELQLAQSTTYELAVKRLVNDKEVDTALTTTIKTVSPVTIVNQTIAPGSTVHDAPLSLTLTADKEIAKVNDLKLLTINPSGEKQEVEIKHEVTGATVRVDFVAPLPRERTFELVLTEIVATDSSYLTTPYTLSFTTSGGPKVVNVNSATYGVDPAKTLLLTADYGLLPGQDLQGLASLHVNGEKVAFSGRVDGNLIRLTPAANLPRCTGFSITVNAGLTNVHGVKSEQAWKFSSRTICQEVFSIGASVEGRAITAYKFGSGASKIVYVGATHGDEIGSKYLLNSWVNELEANFQKIPAHQTIIVIPALNPDAVAKGTRTNANNVDLNRNFPTANWKSDVVMPGGQLLAGGGGSQALSEPESKAIADYLVALQPRLVLTYHSKGSLVIANESGDSVDIANRYGKLSGYGATSESKLGSTFQYDTTGAMENWLYEKPGITTLLIELSTHSSNEFSRNLSALWMTATL